MSGLVGLGLLWCGRAANGSTGAEYGVQFLGNTTDPVTTTAGVVPLSGWNTIANETFTTGTITNSDGSQTATLALSGPGASRGWGDPPNGNGGDSSLNDGYIDAGWTSSAQYAIVTVSGLPNGQLFDVYLYAFGNPIMPQQNSVWLAAYAVNQVTNWVALLGETAGSPPLMANGAAPPVAQPWTDTGYVLCTNFGHNFNTGVPNASQFGDYLLFSNIPATSGQIVILVDADGLVGRSPLNGFELLPVSGSGNTNVVTPQFSNLGNQTITYGTANVVLTGTVGTSTNSLLNGTSVSASVDGITQSGRVYDSSGDFSISYDAVGIPASATPYPVTYTSGAAIGFNSATNTSTTMTVNPLPVVLGGFMTYGATSTTAVPASDLSVVNLVDNDNLTLSGSVTIASTNVGVQAITSFSGLTLGGTAAASYTLTGASGTVTITSLTSQTNFGITEIRTASSTELVAYYVFTNVSGPVWGAVYPTNLVTTSQPSKWTLNGTPVQAISGEFVTEADAVEYHIYLQVPQLVNGTSYTLVTPYSTNSFVFQDSQILCESIKVNQNGYSALSTARYANFGIWLGTGGAQPISGPLPNYTVINEFTGQEIASGTLAAFTPGQVDTSSGDYVYRIDLSGVPAGGPYRIVVSGYGCSYPFGVGGDFARRLAYVAFRGLYYQRCGCPIVMPYAHANIRPTACHTNIYDDEYANSTVETSVNTNVASINVHGGYHDASDAQRNPYAMETPIILMTTYEAFPGAFTTNQFNIPATFDASYNITGGYNGIPDILNEVNWGLMCYTNLQNAPNQPVGAIPQGTHSYTEPAWGINFDQDSQELPYATLTNASWSCGMAAGSFMNFARLIQPYNATLAAAYHAHAVAAYNASGSGITPQQQLYYNIEKFLMDGDTASSNLVESLYTRSSGIENSWDDEAGGFATDNGNIWMASYFMSYVLATNHDKDPKVFNYFTNILMTTANNQIAYLSGDAYPNGWPTNRNPYTQNNFFSGVFTSQGEFAYPCLMEWAVSGQQQYINTVSELMDYDQGLNPIGKCYLTGIGFNRTYNPEQRESIYGEEQGWGGPQPGITVYGPGVTQASQNESGAAQIPNPNNLPRERIWVDDLGNFQWNEFTDYQCEAWPAAIYPVLAQSGVWNPAREPFLYQGASLAPNGSGGYTLQFGGIPYQTYYLQAATSLNGPWTTVSGPVKAGVTGLLQFTHNPASAQTFYRTSGQLQIY